MPPPATATPVLTTFAKTRSPDAFAEIVRQHADLVYAVARRAVGDKHLAEDVTQATFLVLAQKAHSVDPQTLPGWLVNTTRLVALRAIRNRSTRVKLEATAAQLQPRPDAVIDEPPAERITPLLDEALSHLGDADRTAVIMRFLQGKTFAQVGSAMGASEDASRKRVERALEKLRKIFLKRGFSFSVGGLTVVLAAHQASAAPVALAASAAKAALAGGAGVTKTLATQTLSAMLWSKVAWTAALLLPAALAIGVGAVTILGTKEIPMPPNLPIVPAISPNSETNLLGMTLVDPTDDLIKKYALPEKAHRGPIVIRPAADSSNWQNPPTEGCSFWIAEPPVNGFIYKKESSPNTTRRTPKSTRELIDAIVASAASPEEYQKTWDDSRQLAREHAESPKVAPEMRERILTIANMEMPKDDVGKFICRVVYTYPASRIGREPAEESGAKVQKFTDPARTVMALANQEAQRYKRTFIGTEHILLAIVKEGTTPAALILKKHIGDLKKVHDEVQKLPSIKEESAAPGAMPQNAEAKQAVDSAIGESARLNQQNVGPEFLLLGLLQQPESPAVTVLKNLGADIEKIRAEVTASLNESAAATMTTYLRMSQAEFDELRRASTPATQPKTDAARASPQQERLPDSQQKGLAKFERFTDRARKVMALANQEALRYNHEYIGTEHMLLGLVKEDGGVGANVLKNFGVDLRKVQLEVEKLIRNGPDKVKVDRLPQTPRAKKAVEYAIEEARNLHHDYVGTGHLLLGMIRGNEGVAAKVLTNLGLKLEQAREEVVKQIKADEGKTEDDAVKKAEGGGGSN